VSELAAVRFRLSQPKKAQRVGDMGEIPSRAGCSVAKLLRQKAASFRVGQGARTTYPTGKADGARWCHERSQASRGGAHRPKYAGEDGTPEPSGH